MITASSRYACLHIIELACLYVGEVRPPETNQRKNLLPCCVQSAFETLIDNLDLKCPIFLQNAVYLLNSSKTLNLKRLPVIIGKFGWHGKCLQKKNITYLSFDKCQIFFHQMWINLLCGSIYY